jgi:hypothetical protein
MWGGGIYLSQSTPAPFVRAAHSVSNIVLSWTVPSRSFELQENSVLTTTTWLDVTNPPTLNLSNLQGGWGVGVGGWGRT